ncbi:MAG: hypothetical protein ACTSSH_11375 [Candidatus Heimdallarchaeota archaeon]
MTEHYNFFYVRAIGNGSLFVGPKFSNLENDKEKEELIIQAHKTLEEASIDVSRIRRDENYGEMSFYVNNKLHRALELLHEIDEDF